MYALYPRLALLPGGKRGLAVLFGSEIMLVVLMTILGISIGYVLGTEEHMRRILCFGDSNTYGYDPRGGRYDENTRWTKRLDALLGLLLGAVLWETGIRRTLRWIGKRLKKSFPSGRNMQNHSE